MCEPSSKTSTMSWHEKPHLITAHELTIDQPLNWTYKSSTTSHCWASLQQLNQSSSITIPSPSLRHQPTHPPTTMNQPISNTDSPSSRHFTTNSLSMNHIIYPYWPISWANNSQSHSCPFVIQMFPWFHILASHSHHFVQMVTQLLLHKFVNHHEP